MTEHEAYIRRCLELARTAVEGGDTPFGSVIVRDGQVIAESYNQVRTKYDIADHGEISAIREACQALRTLDLSGCTLYTNAEPCYMCSYAIRMARISEVVIGAPALDRGGVSSRYPILTDPDVAGWGPPPRIIRDVLKDECIALLQKHGLYHI